jgi:hypothetical protein
VRLAQTHDAELVLVVAAGAELPPSIQEIFAGSAADVAVLVGGPVAHDAAIAVPFGGGENDWAALQLGAWLSAATALPLRLVGRAAAAGRRDASALLADASLALQRVTQVAAEPVVADSLLEAAAGSSLVVVGLPSGSARTGLGDARRALVQESARPVLLVHAGIRPGGLAPAEARSTRFTWTLEQA